jgi:DNA repair protein RadC
MTMAAIAPHDRPREKLEQSGASALGDNELLAIVLSHGLRSCSVLDLATDLLVELGGLPGLVRASHDRLRQRKGIGRAGACRIIAAMELGRRTLLRRDERPRISTPKEVASMLAPEFGARPQEHFGVLLLDARHCVRRTRVLSIGAMDGTYVHPREVFREAVTAGAMAMVLFHNHPSGDPTPSGDDVLLTQRLQAAGDLMGIPVLDHVIVANDKYYSFKEAASPSALMAKKRKRPE